MEKILKLERIHGSSYVREGRKKKPTFYGHARKRLDPPSPLPVLRTFQKK